jgi:hypothetical protein
MKDLSLPKLAKAAKSWPNKFDRNLDEFDQKPVGEPEHGRVDRNLKQVPDAESDGDDASYVIISDGNMDDVYDDGKDDDNGDDDYVDLNGPNDN